MSEQSKTLSIIALILALFVGGIPGLIVGIIARKKEGPNAMNLIAIILGVIVFIVLILVFVVFAGTLTMGLYM